MTTLQCPQHIPENVRQEHALRVTPSSSSFSVRSTLSSPAIPCTPYRTIPTPLSHTYHIHTTFTHTSLVSSGMVNKAISSRRPVSGATQPMLLGAAPPCMGFPIPSTVQDRYRLSAAPLSTSVSGSEWHPARLSIVQAAWRAPGQLVSQSVGPQPTDATADQPAC
ncbi:hypothetical protein E2C01_032312 [Portunus trituberculatus]|uniref:Uncharacterized protein n=1 Tax=Portunus trituberculatus TaxID=210409 RepID=A0A5B7F0F0_PORTR|nr:hypothetical protein [Portunus trituberculatus]